MELWGLWSRLSSTVRDVGTSLILTRSDHPYTAVLSVMQPKHCTVLFALQPENWTVLYNVYCSFVCTATYKHWNVLFLVHMSNRLYCLSCSLSNELYCLSCRLLGVVTWCGWWTWAVTLSGDTGHVPRTSVKLFRIFKSPPLSILEDPALGLGALVLAKQDSYKFLNLGRLN